MKRIKGKEWHGQISMFWKLVWQHCSAPFWVPSHHPLTHSFKLTFSALESLADVMVVGLRGQRSVSDVFVGVQQWQIGCDGITGVFTGTLGDADETVHSTSNSTAQSHVIVVCKTDSMLHIKLKAAHITQITCYGGHATSTWIFLKYYIPVCTIWEHLTA